MRAQPGGIPHFFPLRIFEIAWVLEHLTFGELSLKDDNLIDPCLWTELESAVGPDGVSMDPAFGINDGDTTAVAARVLTLGRERSSRESCSALRIQRHGSFARSSLRETPV